MRNLTPENTALLAEYAAHLEHSPLAGHTPRTYLGAVRAYLTWLQSRRGRRRPAERRHGQGLGCARLPELPGHGGQAGHGHGQQAPRRTDRTSTCGAASASPRASSGTRSPGTRPRPWSPRAKLRYLRAVEACPRARDRALALLPLYAGTRIAEIAALDVTDVAASARKGELHLVGKGEKSRTVPVHPRLREALAAWLAERPARPGADSPALFLSGRGTRMTTDAIADVIQAHHQGRRLWRTT